MGSTFKWNCQPLTSSEHCYHHPHLPAYRPSHATQSRFSAPLVLHCRPLERARICPLSPLVAPPFLRHVRLPSFRTLPSPHHSRALWPCPENLVAATSRTARALSCSRRLVGAAQRTNARSRSLSSRRMDTSTHTLCVLFFLLVLLTHILCSV